MHFFFHLQKKCIASIDDFLFFNMCKWQWTIYYYNPHDVSGETPLEWFRVLCWQQLKNAQQNNTWDRSFIKHNVFLLLITLKPLLFGHIVFLYCFTNIKLSTKIKNNLDNNHIKTYIHTLKFMTSKMHIAEISQSFPGQSYVCAIYLSDST